MNKHQIISVLFFLIGIALSGNHLFAQRSIETQTPFKHISAGNKIQPPAPPAPSVASIDLLWRQPDIVSLPNAYLKLTERNILQIEILARSSVALTQSNFTLYVNGAAVKGSKMRTVDLRALPQNTGYLYQTQVELSEGNNKLYVEAGAGGVTKRSETFTVAYEPLKPDLYVLSIGTKSNLQYTEKDARDFAALFAGQGGKADKLFHQTFIETLIGAEASSVNIMNKIIELRSKNIQPNDVVLVYISSHGFKHNNGALRIQGSDFTTIQIERTSVDIAEINEQLAAIDSKRYLFLDACQSGSALDGSKASAMVLQDAIQNLLKAKNAINIITSSNDNEYSWEDSAWQNGAFTKAIKEAMQDAKADTDKNGIVTTDELFSYVSSRVSNLVANSGKKDTYGNRARQTPQYKGEIGNVGIFVVE